MYLQRIKHKLLHLTKELWKQLLTKRNAGDALTRIILSITVREEIFGVIHVMKMDIFMELTFVIANQVEKEKEEEGILDLLQDHLGQEEEGILDL